MVVHALAKSAFSASGKSGLYDRARPSYPIEAIGEIFKLLAGRKHASLIELGPGTGIFTRMLLHPPNEVGLTASGHIGSILAVEPAEGMRQDFERNTHAPQGIELSIKDGSFTEIPAEDSSADAVVIAQAFHWAHPHYDASIKEIARVLRPGGLWCMIWNLEDREAAQWVAKIRDAYEQHEKGTPQYRLAWWKQIYNEPSYSQHFVQSQHFTYRREIPTTVDGVVDRALSKSFITDLSESDQQQVEKNLRKILAEATDKKALDDQGHFAFPYRTDLYVFEKKA
ncbi:uncharacterized protein L969DRAFT_96844 [Mixia osmundae IAM 14324]|uniref:Methyltransferase type 11 domain-containing protein n=1 Tax=Mixia osmundae (strain CBS 9802 / IAM 14324 / JCM 22182 / KY 12970) TaxID=764103 RepID=G7E293_MIXOS|nr:uncharacterized protein L969DRAFT_96844 [Mixia osmundae IAM 14324]KEI36826.1 hypothetical protein L969DRAFT_96844 [Mixia osmundae IAM 14324]GAA96953.1 hypothetical protein E5Q_03627 [Mixia osmundae IAM 14324]